MLFSQDIGIDLGTSNTLVYVKGKGVVLKEPSVVAVDVTASPKRVVAVGREAKEMIGRTPGSITALRPLNDGVIADFDMTAEMIQKLIQKALKNTLFSRARVMISVPSGSTEVERRAVHDAAREAGARYVSIIEGPMAAAIGAGLPIMDASGSMVVDLGGGNTEVAVLSLGDIVASRSIRVGGDHLDDAIVSYLKRSHNILVGERTAEDIKLKIGSAYSYEGEGSVDVRGRSLSDGLPKNIEITSSEIRMALLEHIKQILDLVHDTLEQIPPELASDIVDKGIILTGGGALLRGFDKAISSETKMPVAVARNPMECVIKGTGRCLEKDILNLSGKRR
ncbi:MAG: rod shape-determining protein [Oscillospiraceae bacterium]|jgi:rod shape-determining protein MreB|nr:rod shape-determining protein [Oscillospiraceae bacterium]